MEFNEKLQQLRKQRGLTQEELAAALFVSRTAVSKWEAGRGYPNLASLQAAAKFFGVTVDALLSGEELITLSQADGRKRESRMRCLLFGLLDLAVSMLLFLPFFGQRAGGAVQSVSLLSLSAVSPQLRAVYFAAVAALVLCGIFALALQGCERMFWLRCAGGASLFFNMAGALLFVMGRQPYAATFLLVFLAVKVLTLLKRQ